MSLLEDLFEAYYDARRNKRNTTNQLRFEMNLEENLIELYHEIAERRYQVGRSICFMINRPVDREVFAADFRDRVVHHLLFNYINPYFDPTFITDSYSCRKGKGTLYGIRRLDHHIRSCSLNYTQPCYVLKLDLQGYFMNINRQILFNEIMKTMRRQGLRKTAEGVCWKDTYQYETAIYLLPLIVFNDPVEGCYRKSPLSSWDVLPASKSLFFSPEGCGLPIGNLTSQLFSNIYLNGFDHYVKRELHIKHYGRYVDDFYLIHTDKELLLSLIPLLRAYLKDQLGAILHPHKLELLYFRQGVSFLGAHIKPYRIYLKPRTFGNFSTALHRLKYDLDNAATPSKEQLFQLRSSVNSYLGIMRHYTCKHRMDKTISQNRYLFLYGYLTAPNIHYVIRESLLDSNSPHSPPHLQT